MVETAVRPRPGFSTFLLSDQNTGGDGLSFYNYKKLLRSQKVSILQKKRATASIPGYKPALEQYKAVLKLEPPPAAADDTISYTRRGELADKKTRQQFANAEVQTCKEPPSLPPTAVEHTAGSMPPQQQLQTMSKSIDHDPALKEQHYQQEPANTAIPAAILAKIDRPQSQYHQLTPSEENSPIVLHPQKTSLTARLAPSHPMTSPPAGASAQPADNKKQQIVRVKSAVTARPSAITSSDGLQERTGKGNISNRPYTAAGNLLSSQTQTSPPQRVVKWQQQLTVVGYPPSAATPTTAAPDSSLPPNYTAEQDNLQTNTEEEAYQDPDIDSLVKSYYWSTSTKKAYDEVGWENKLKMSSSSTASPASGGGPMITSNQLMPSVVIPPDPVSMRFTNKRNELYPQDWQCLGNAWDIVQSRPTSTYNRPRDKNTFCSPFKHNRQIPGYLGCTPGANQPDNAEGTFEPHLNIYSHQPRPTKISRRPNIPGYTGCTMWSNTKPANHTLLSRVGHPTRQTTHTKTYKSLPVDSNMSPFIRTGVFSKLISLNAPYNPFNKIEPTVQMHG